MKIYMLLILRQNYCACETSLILSLMYILLNKDDLNDPLPLVLCEYGYGYGHLRASQLPLWIFG